MAVWGITCEATKAVKVVFNDIHNNVGDGLAMLRGREKSIVAYNNLMENRGSYELVNGAVAADARFNFWGEATTAGNGSRREPEEHQQDLRFT